MSTGFYVICSRNPTKKSDTLKTKEKLKIMWDDIVDYNVMYTMAGTVMNSVQYFKKRHFLLFFIFFHNFHIISFPYFLRGFSPRPVLL